MKSSYGSHRRHRILLNGDFIGIDPRTLARDDAYKWLLHCVAPRPIAFVSTMSSDGLPNLAPFSYFMLGGANPASVVISPLNDRYGQPKDTLRNIQETGEYTINVVTFEMRERMNQASAEYSAEVSEWHEAGFFPTPAVKVRPPRVSESPIALECKLFKIVEHGEGHMAANYVIGEAVYIHIASELVKSDGGFDATKVDYVARMGGDWYCRANGESMFELPRPSATIPNDK